VKKGDVPIKGAHKPLVDEDIFTQVQQVFYNNRDIEDQLS